MPTHPNICAALVMLLALLASAAPRSGAAAPAQALADPTQPAAIAAPAPVRRDAAAPLPAAPAWPRLQSVQIAAHGGSSALVDGRVVRVGERIGELSVVSIDAQGISLRGPRFEQRLALLPGVLKTASGSPPPTSRQAVAAAAKELP